MKKQVSFDAVEKAVYQVKYKSAPYRSMEPEVQSAFITSMLYRVSTITGCPMPETKLELDVLEGELMLLFSENPAYSSLNIEEVALAFRMNATEESGENVKHWQQVFNIEYLAMVIRKYLDIRLRLEAKVEIEQKRIEPPKADRYGVIAEKRTQEENDQDTRDVIQYHYEKFLAGELEMAFIMHYEYNLLDRIGVMQLSRADKDTLMGIGKERRIANLRKAAITRNDFSGLDQLAVDFANNMASADEIVAITHEAKRLAVWDFFLDLQALGIKNVFDIKNFKP